MSVRVALRNCGYVGAAAAALLILNLLDAIFTLGYLQLGAAEEANPFMEVLTSNGPIGFMVVKLGLVSLCVTLLWRLQHHRAAMTGIFALAGGYTVLVAYHISAVPGVASYIAAN